MIMISYIGYEAKNVELTKIINVSCNSPVLITPSFVSLAVLAVAVESMISEIVLLSLVIVVASMVSEVVVFSNKIKKNINLYRL